jgi:twitching motility protein PilT
LLRRRHFRRYWQRPTAIAIFRAMTQLDKLLAAMTASRADALVLDDGEPARIESAGALRPLTKGPLARSQIVAILRESANAESREKLDGGKPVTFLRTTETGAYVVRAMLQGDGLHVEARIDDRAEFKRVTGLFHAVEEEEFPEDAPAAAAAPPGATVPAGAPAHASAGQAPVAGDGERPGGSPAAAVPTPPAGDGQRLTPTTQRSLDAIFAFEGSDRAQALLDTLLRKMVEVGSSDLHLRVGEPPILRHHGEMQRMSDFAPLSDEQLTAMVRSIMPERNRVEYEETNDTDYAYEIAGVARFRANAARDRKGGVAVFRQIPATVVTVEQMGISDEVQRLCFLTKGLVLVTGPTGSGKSTTLCALIDLVNRARSDHVITIEDPIEFVHPNKSCIITQRQVGVHTKSFKSALRAALREDPDIILVGEMRDLETVAIAIETAETGHLVFGTLHTTTAAGTIDRIIDQFPADRQEQIRVMLAESLKGVISQTLCKKIGGGRVAAREVLLSLPSVTNLIREAKTFQINSVIQTSKRLGMVPLNDALMHLIDTNQVEPKEAYIKSVEKTGLVQQMKNRGLDVSFAESDAPAPAKGPEQPAAGVKRR